MNDKVLNYYNWNVYFADFQTDILNMAYAVAGNHPKTIRFLFMDIDRIRKSIRPDDVKRSKGVRYLATAFDTYTKNVKDDVKAKDSKDLTAQSDYLDSYTNDNWKRQVKFNVRC